MPDPLIYIDGQYVPAKPGVIDIFTPGRCLYKGVFETIRCIGGEPEFFNAHLERLFKGLKALKISHTCSKSGIKRIVAQVLRRNPGIKCARLRILVFKEGKAVHVVVMALKYTPPNNAVYRQGYMVTTYKTNRTPTAATAWIKSLDYSLFAKAYQRAVQQGFDEALLVNTKGFVFEACRANVIAIMGERIITPPLSSGCLNGIIRQEVLRMARSQGIKISEENLTLAQLKKADAVFLTNSLIGLVPVRKIA